MYDLMRDDCGEDIEKTHVSMGLSSAVSQQ